MIQIKQNGRVYLMNEATIDEDDRNDPSFDAVDWLHMNMLQASDVSAPPVQQSGEGNVPFNFDEPCEAEYVT